MQVIFGINRRKFSFIIILLLLFLASHQALFGKTLHDTESLKYNLVDLNKTGMLVLGTWGLANIAGGLTGNFTQKGTNKYFWQMNALWNSVNISIAAIGYFGAQYDFAGYADLLSSAETYKKAYLFNAGLDIGYIVGGFYLKELAKRKNNIHDRLTGYGNAIILQGTFLFVFDLVMYGINQHYTNINITPWINSLQNSAGLSMSILF